MDQSIEQSINQSIDQSMDQTTQQPINQSIKTVNAKTDESVLTTRLTASERASRWINLSFWLISNCFIANQWLKFSDLRNAVYKPSQSPFVGDVSWGPATSIVLRNSSKSNSRNVGGDLNGAISRSNGIKVETYRSKGIMKLCESSKKYFLISDDWASTGRLDWTPFSRRFTRALSLLRYDLYSLYRPCLKSTVLLSFCGCFGLGDPCKNKKSATVNT